MESQPRNLRDEVPRVIAETIGFGTTIAFEMIRAGLVNPKYSPTKMLLGEQMPAQLNVDSPAFGVLQNSGDLFDGFWLSFATYNALELVDRLQHRFTGRYIPQRVKSGVTMLAAVGVVTLTETGVFNGGVADLSDIPAGIIGAVIFQGVNLVGRKLPDILSRRPIQ